MPQGRPSKAALRLLEAGVTVTELAAELGVSPQAISLHLNGGTTEVPRALEQAISRRLGPDTYAVWEAVAEARIARIAEKADQ